MIRWNGGSYVGQTITMATHRWEQHISQLRKGEHHNKRLQEAFYSVGLCGLSFSVLETDVDVSQIDDKEDFWTEQFSSVNSRPKKKLKEEQIEKVLDMIKRGCTYREIGKEIGISIGTVCSIRRQYEN